MNNPLITFSRNINTKISKYLSTLQMDLDIPEEIILKIWKQVQEEYNNQLIIPNLLVKSQYLNKKSIARSTKAVLSTCQAILKTGSRKDEACAKKVSTKSTTGKYCCVHLKHELASNNQGENFEGTFFKRNVFGNYTFGDTGLILKSATDTRIIGRQTPDGNITDITTEDIELCKNRGFDYIERYNSKGLEIKPEETGPSTVEYTAKIQFI